MRIARFQAENYRRLSAVELDIGEDNVIEISGKNGAGKSSILDAIWDVIGGRAANNDNPVQRGKTKAEVELVLEGDHRFVAKRTWTEDGKSKITLKQTLIQKRDGKPKDLTHSSPQSVLDTLFETVAFDPGKFMFAAPAEQAEILKRASDLDLGDIEEEIDQTETFRRDAKRDFTRAEVEFQEAGEKAPEEDPGKVQPIGELTKKIRSLEEKRETAVEGIRKHQEFDERIKSAEALVKKLQDEKRNLISEGELIQAREDASVQVDGLHKELEHSEAKIREKNAWDRKEEKEKAFLEKKKEHDDLDEELKKLRTTRLGMISAAAEKIPVKGLALDEDGKTVIFNDLAFDSCSQSEKIRVSMALAMALNPELKVIQIRDGSLLDQDSLKQIKSMAKKHGYQIWIEIVDTSGDIGIVIEEGQVIKDNR